MVITKLSSKKILIPLQMTLPEWITQCVSSILKNFALQKTSHKGIHDSEKNRKIVIASVAPLSNNENMEYGKPFR